MITLRLENKKCRGCQTRRKPPVGELMFGQISQRDGGGGNFLQFHSFGPHTSSDDSLSPCEQRHGYKTLQQLSICGEITGGGSLSPAEIERMKGFVDADVWLQGKKTGAAAAPSVGQRGNCTHRGTNLILILRKKLGTGLKFKFISISSPAKLQNKQEEPRGYLLNSTLFTEYLKSQVCKT